MHRFPIIERDTSRIDYLLHYLLNLLSSSLNAILISRDVNIEFSVFVKCTCYV